MTLPPDLLQRFLAALRKCAAGRGPLACAGALVRAAGKSLTLFADVAGVGLRFDAPHASRKGSAVVPLDLLKSLERAGPDPVELVPGDSGAGLARWSKNGTAVERDFPAAPPDSFRPFPLPRRWSPEAERFRVAMHEAGKTAAREPTRYAIDRVQVRGKAGQVVASDARQALIQGDFVFPFTEDLCVPAVPVFGARELAGSVRIGRTASRLVVGVGDWTVWLPADPHARFPDVAAVVPRPAEPTRIDFGDADAERLLAPAGLDQLGDAVTLDASAAGVRLRGRPGRGESIELELAASRADGPPVRVALDRSHLDRLLRLGFRSLSVAGPEKPVVATDPTRTYLAMALDPSVILPPGSGSRRTATSIARAEPTPRTPPEEPTVKPRPEPEPEPPGEEALDPLAEAAALKAALWEAAQRAARLLAALKARHKERRVLDQVVSSLKALDLGRRGDW